MQSRPKCRDRDLVKPLRPTPNRKIQDTRIENVWIMPIFFYKYSKNIVVTLKFFWHFFYLLWLLQSANTAD